MATKSKLEGAAKAIVITGATGRIGSRLLAMLSKNPGYHLQLIGRNIPAGFALPKNAKFTRADLCCPENYSHALKGADAAIHLAGLVSFHAKRSELMEQNAQNTRTFAKACADAGVKKFIYASSIAVYGKNIGGQQVDESFPPSSTTDYGMSKLAGEKAALEFAGIMKIAIMRLGLVYGGGIDFGYYKMLDYIQRGKMKIVGSGENHLPFVHIDDAAEAFLLACEKGDYESGSVFNICGELKTQRECLDMASRALGVPAPLEHVDFGTASALAALNKAFACATGLGNCKKAAESEEFLWVIASDRQIIGRAARDVLGFRPKVALSDGIAEVARAYLKDTKATK